MAARPFHADPRLTGMDIRRKRLPEDPKACRALDTSDVARTTDSEVGRRQNEPHVREAIRGKEAK